MKQTFHDFELDDDLDRVDFATVHAWLAATYWSPNITRERVITGAQNSSLVVGAYAPTGEQAAYMRVVSDRTRFAYIADVYVAQSFRKRGLAKALVRFATAHPLHNDIDKWLLATKDAHDVYTALGFKLLPNPENYMVFKPGKDPT